MTDRPTKETGVSAERTERFSVRGLELAYHCFGDANRPVLLMLHGFLDNGLSFREVASRLADDFFVIAPDFRGHGQSGWVGDGGYYHFQDYYVDVTTLLDALGIERFGLIGHSMGGSVAVGLNSLRPEAVDGLVVLEGLGPPSEDISTAPDRLKRFVTSLRRPPIAQSVEGRRSSRRVFASVDEAAARMRQLNRHLTEARAIDLAKDGTEPAVTESGEDGVAWRFDPLHRTPSARPFNFEEFRHFFGRIDSPVLGLYGEDSGFSLDHLLRRHSLIPSLRVGVVPRAGHNMHHERPDAVADAVRFWFGGDRKSAMPDSLIESDFELRPLSADAEVRT